MLIHLYTILLQPLNIMNKPEQTPEIYLEALGKLRAELRLKRGYGTRIAQKLTTPKVKVSRFDVYNVAWGRSQNPVILKALVDEAKNATSSANESFEIISNYLFGAAA